MAASASSFSAVSMALSSDVGILGIDGGLMLEVLAGWVEPCARARKKLNRSYPDGGRKKARRGFPPGHTS